MAAEPDDEDSWLYGDDSVKAEQKDAAESASGPARVVRNDSEKPELDDIPEDVPEEHPMAVAENGNGANEEEEESEIESDDSDDDIKVTIRDIQATNYMAPAAASLQRAARTSVQSVTAPVTVVPTPAPQPAKGLDVDAVGKINGVSTYEFDLDSVDDKPWRKPGADITDYFNYGFTEDTWKQYCEKQRRLRIDNVPTQLPKKGYEVREMKSVGHTGGSSNRTDKGYHHHHHHPHHHHHRADAHDENDGRHTPEEIRDAVLPPGMPPIRPPSTVGAPPFLPPQAMAALGFPPPGAMLPGGPPRQPPPFGLPPPLGAAGRVPRLPLPPGIRHNLPPLPGLPPFDGTLPLPPGLPPKLPADSSRSEGTGGTDGGPSEVHLDRPPLFPGDGNPFPGADGLRPPPGFEGAFTGDMSLGEAFAALAGRRAAASRSRSRSPPPYGGGGPSRSRSPSRPRSLSRTPSPGSGVEDDRAYDRSYRESRRADRDYHRHHRTEYIDVRNRRDRDYRDRERERDMREREREHEARRRYERDRRDEKERDRHRDRERYEREERDRRDRDRREEERVREEREREERSRHEEKEKEKERERAERAERSEREERDRREESKRDDDKRRDRKRRRSTTPAVEEVQPRRHKRSKATKEKA
ncbi:pre-mRNA 3'-end-processing factor FIP1-like isoform X3 [Sycon ciliatum]|uniref:pre-mRNA 3'-end-processing factor FIP1-like isoform X3 n=1 Tax=Sycon ciliatum TaxID=27933 RepID=UPI0031F65FF8